MLSNELRDQQEGKATRWAAFFDFQRAVAPCLNGCLFPTALISSCLNCRSLGGAEICLVSKRMFIPDGTPVLVTEYYILTRRNIETLNMVVCSATNVESCLCLKARKVWQAKTENRNQFVDIMRGIAMLLVVLGHTMTGCTVDSQKSFLFNIIWSLQMPLFILISGFVTKYSRQISDGKGLWKYVKRRTVAYMLPWAVWSFLVKYNWNKILRANRESIISVAGTVSDDVRKRNTKIVNFLAQTYPAKNQPELVDCLQSFVL